MSKTAVCANGSKKPKRWWKPFETDGSMRWWSPGTGSEVVYTLKGADHTYRILIETMDEGAAILSESGIDPLLQPAVCGDARKTASGVTGGSVHGTFSRKRTKRFWSCTSRVLAGKSHNDECAESPDRRHARAGFLVPAEDGRDEGRVHGGDRPDRFEAFGGNLKAYSERLFRKNTELKQRAEQLARLSAELTMTEQRERKRLSKDPARRPAAAPCGRQAAGAAWPIRSELKTF
jgi:hypothetical protein